MGIKNLHTFFRKHVPEVYATQPLSAYAGQRVAIDTFIYIYQFKRQSRIKWMSSFVHLLLQLQTHRIQCVLVYDTKTPLLKQQAVRERRERRRQLEDTVDTLRTAKQDYETIGAVHDCLRAVMAKQISPLLRPSAPSEDWIDMRIIDTELARLEKQIVRISPEDIDATKELAGYLGIPCITAPFEAETVASHLCVHQLVDAVLSDDTDVLVYGTPVLMSNLHNGNVVELKTPTVLQALDLSLEEFRDFCIMCGTDYNKNVFRVGPEKAFRFIKKYKTIETVASETGLDVAVLHHLDVRDLFTVPEHLEYTLQDVEQGAVDIDHLTTFLAEHHCSNAMLTQLLVVRAG